MGNDPRDILWKNSYELYYDVYFNELLAHRLAEKWSFIDLVLKILIAAAVLLTTVLGVFLWDDPVSKFIWFNLSLIASVLVVSYIVINTAGKIKLQLKINKEFWGLRNAIKSFRDDIDREKHFDIEKEKSQYVIYVNTFIDICSNNPPDSLAKDGIFKTVQNEVNRRLSGIIHKGSERMRPGKRIISGVNRGAPYLKPQPRPRELKYTAHD